MNALREMSPQQGGRLSRLCGRWKWGGSFRRCIPVQTTLYLSCMSLYPGSIRVAPIGPFLLFLYLLSKDRSTTSLLDCLVSFNNQDLCNLGYGIQVENVLCVLQKDRLVSLFVLQTNKIYQLKSIGTIFGFVSVFMETFFLNINLQLKCSFIIQNVTADTWNHRTTEL